MRAIDEEQARPAPEKPELASWGLSHGDEIDKSLVVIEPLGGGSRYEVFRAWDRALFCQVAVKVVRPDRLDTERPLDAFDREVTMAEGLRHPNLVRLLRWERRLPRPYLVLELITAPTVADLLDDVGAINAPEIVLLAIRMLSALHYLHERSLLHLDVKPANVTTGDPPRLLDLSIARYAPGPTRLAHAIGTPVYMAPEQCLHEPVTPATDLFGLGCTLYEALSGMAPFRDGDANATERGERYPQLVEDPPPVRDMVPAVPPRLETFVMSCLAREPGRRPRSAVDAAIELHRILEGFGNDDLLAWPKRLEVRPR